MPFAVATLVVDQAGRSHGSCALTSERQQIIFGAGALEQSAGAIYRLTACRDDADDLVLRWDVPSEHVDAVRGDHRGVRGTGELDGSRVRAAGKRERQR